MLLSLITLILFIFMQVRTSFGEDYGDHGNIYLPYMENSCGLGSFPAFIFSEDQKNRTGLMVFNQVLPSAVETTADPTASPSSFPPSSFPPSSPPSSSPSDSQLPTTPPDLQSPSLLPTSSYAEASVVREEYDNKDAYFRE